MISQLYTQRLVIDAYRQVTVVNKLMNGEQSIIRLFADQ